MDPVYIKAPGKHNSVDTRQSNEINEQQINEKSVQQVDDERLLNIIESADPHQAVQLLEGNNHFSQDGLDRALISACRHGLKYLVQTLVRLGANVQSKDTQGNTPLLICAGNGFIDIVHFLLKKKAGVNAFNSVGDPALILSIRAAGSLEMVRVLLEQEGIDISHQNQDGYTALMKAVEVEDVDVMKILMERYSNEETDGGSGQVSNPWCLKTMNYVNSQGLTAEQTADKCGLWNVYEILKTHLINAVSPLDLAIDRHDVTSLQMLLDCHFIGKQNIQNALMKMFEQCDVKDIETFTVNDVLIIKMLLKHEKMVDLIWDEDSSLLSDCVKTGDYDLVVLLCQQLDQQQQMTSQRSSQALTTAAELGRCDLINRLLNYNVDINNNNTYRVSPLYSALRHGHLESAKLLIQHGAKMDIKMALGEAVLNQPLENVKFLFEFCQQEGSSSGTQVEPNTLTALLRVAVFGRSFEAIGYLLDAGADVNYDYTFDWAALRMSRHGDVKEYLTSRGANVKLQLRYVQDWFLQTFSERGRNDMSSGKEVLKVLLENGVSVNERLKGGKTLLMGAAGRESCGDVLQLLLDRGADINAQDDNGNTALMEAVRVNCNPNVNVLIKFHKANNLSLDVQNPRGLTALMFAVQKPWSEIVKLLINRYDNVNVCDAMFKEMTAVLRTLIAAGSDVNCQNNEGLSPLMLASQNCWVPIILILLQSRVNVDGVIKYASTKTALSFLTAYSYTGSDLGCCIQVFIKRGARLSDLNPSCLHIMIRNSDVDFIPELIQGGLAPVDVETKSLNLEIGDWEQIPSVSPLCVALLVGDVSLARYFVGKLFLTSSDVTSWTLKKIRQHVLKRRRLLDSLTFLDELSSQPWSLFQLAFVSVSSAVGSSPGRENRVDMLPLPQIMKDKLLFKSTKMELDVLKESRFCFRERRMHYYL